MNKKIELIGENGCLGTYEENTSRINEILITNIDLSLMVARRKIVLTDTSGQILCELYIPQNVLVKVDYLR